MFFPLTEPPVDEGGETGNGPFLLALEEAVEPFRDMAAEEVEEVRGGVWLFETVVVVVGVGVVVVW